MLDSATLVSSVVETAAIDPSCSLYAQPDVYEAATVFHGSIVQPDAAVYVIPFALDVEPPNASASVPPTVGVADGHRKVMPDLAAAPTAMAGVPFTDVTPDVSSMTPVMFELLNGMDTFVSVPFDMRPSTTMRVDDVDPGAVPVSTSVVHRLPAVSVTGSAGNAVLMARNSTTSMLPAVGGALNVPMAFPDRKDMAAACTTDLADGGAAGTGRSVAAIAIIMAGVVTAAVLAPPRESCHP